MNYPNKSTGNNKVAQEMVARRRRKELQDKQDIKSLKEKAKEIKMANFKELFKTEPTTDKPSKSTEEKTVRNMELAEQAVKLDDEAKKIQRGIGIQSDKNKLNKETELVRKYKRVVKKLSALLRMKDFPDKFKGVAEVLIEKYSKRADAIKKDILEADLKEEDKIYGVKDPSKASKKKKREI